MVFLGKENISLKARSLQMERFYGNEDFFKQLLVDGIVAGVLNLFLDGLAFILHLLLKEGPCIFAGIDWFELIFVK